MNISLSRLRWLPTLGLLVSAGCEKDPEVLAPRRLSTLSASRQSDDHESDPDARLKLGAVTFADLPMVTTVMLHVQCSGVITAVQVAYRADGDRGITPRTPVSSCPADVALLGLLPSTRYTTHVTAWGKDDVVRSAPGPALSTQALPPGLPKVTTRGIAPTGLTALSVETPKAGFALVLDSRGRIRWYLDDSSHFVLDFQPQPNHRYTMSTISSLDAPRYTELDILGDPVRRWTVSAGQSTDLHDFTFTRPGTALLLGLDSVTMDLTAYGGSSTARVVGNVLQEIDSAGRVLFTWDAFHHFSITDIDPSLPLTSPRIDWTHDNATEIDFDGNYLVSVRHFSEITKIDSRTGRVIWRWGGLKNQFKFIGDTLKFAFQHGITRLANGNYILFDNGNTHTPRFSRAVEYRLDQSGKTSTLVWSYRPSPDIFSGYYGYAQRLPNGNTLVTFGPQGILHEVSPSSQLLWTLSLPPGATVYRAYRIQSLYSPQAVSDSPGQEVLVSNR